MVYPTDLGLTCILCGYFFEDQGTKQNIPNAFGIELFIYGIFFQNQGAKHSISGAITRLCNEEIDKIGSSR